MQITLAAFLRNTPDGKEAQSIVQKCVHCGFCTATCPTYQLLGDELDGPRGRIYLMKQVLEGTLPLASAQPHLDRCLGCLACEPACPSGVPYRDLISPFRATHEAQVRRPWPVAVRRWLAARVIPYPQRFRWALVGARLGRALGRLVPAFLRPMLALVDYLLGESCALIHQSLFVKRPGPHHLPLHTDQDQTTNSSPFLPHAQVANATWVLTDFDAAFGIDHGKLTLLDFEDCNVGDCSGF